MQANELQIDASDVEETAEEDEDAAERFEPLAQETDGEYLPSGELGSPSASVLSAWKRRAQLKRDKREKSKAVEGDSKREPVHCPVCHKSFKSKYYLKVHNR